MKAVGHCLRISATWNIVWQDLAKFSPLWQFYVVFGKVVNVLWPTFPDIGQFFIVVKAKYWTNNNPPIWSRCLCMRSKYKRHNLKKSSWNKRRFETKKFDGGVKNIFKLSQKHFSGQSKDFGLKFDKQLFHARNIKQQLSR